MSEIRDLQTLRAEYERRSSIINSRIEEFRDRYKLLDDSALFDELAYTLLAAGSSAVSALRGESCIKGIWNEKPSTDCQIISSMLKTGGCRFHTIRGKYIYLALTHFKPIGLKTTLDKLLTNDKFELRDYLVRNIKGLGYKASSHFSRNIGIFGFAVLDKHILNGMKELGVISDSERPPSNKPNYLRLEKVFYELAENVGLSVEQLDFTLWSAKTGVVLK